MLHITIIREIQIKIIMKYYQTPIRMAKILLAGPSTGEAMEQLELPYFAGGNAIWNTLEASYKAL